VSIRRRIRPGRDTGVAGESFANLLTPFILRRASKSATAFAPESQRVGDRLGSSIATRLQRASERAPLEPHPHATFEAIEMLVETILRHQPELGLNAMEEPVEHYLLPHRRIVLWKKGQGKTEPPHTAPRDGAVHETLQTGCRPSGSRSASADAYILVRGEMGAGLTGHGLA